MQLFFMYIKRYRGREENFENFFKKRVPLIVMPKEVFENDPKDFISNIKILFILLMTDDDKQLEAHSKSFTNQ